MVVCQRKEPLVVHSIETDFHISHDDVHVYLSTHFTSNAKANGEVQAANQVAQFYW